MDRLWLGHTTSVCLRCVMLLVTAAYTLLLPALLAFGRVPIAFATWPACAAGLTACDVVLWAELGARFITPMDVRGTVVRSHRRVARAYVRGDASNGFLLLDLLCRTPWERFGGSTAFTYRSLPRLLLALHARAAALTEVFGRPRHLSPAQRVLLLAALSLVGLHWYACALYAAGLALSAAHRPNWLEATALEQDAAHWSAAGAYLQSFDRALLTLLGNGDHGQTHEEVCISLAGVLLGLP